MVKKNKMNGWLLIILGAVLVAAGGIMATYGWRILPSPDNTKTSINSKAAIIVFPPKYNYIFYWIQEKNIQPIIEPYSRNDQPNSNELLLNIKNVGSVPCKNIKIKWSINSDKIIKESQNNKVLNIYNLKISTSPNFISLSKETGLSTNSWSAPFADEIVSKVEYLVSTPNNKAKDMISIPSEIEWIYLIGIIAKISDFNKMQTIECPDITINIEANCVDGKYIKSNYLVKSNYSYIPPEFSWDRLKERYDNIPIYLKERPPNMIRGTLKIVEVKEN